MIRSWFRTVLVATSLSIALAPATVFADDTRGEQPAAKGKAKGKGKGKGEGKKEHQFPMKAEAFRDMVEKRIAHAREKLDRVLERKEVPDALRTQIKKDFEDGATAVRTAATRVSADGTVTKDEAKQVRDLAKDLKKKARDKYDLGGKRGKEANERRTRGQRAS
jgi:hypothetical protein